MKTRSRSRSILRKTLSLLGMLAIGDAIAFAIAPKHHARVWSFRGEPRWMKRQIGDLVSHRGRGLATSGAEAALGASFLVLADRGA